MGCFYSREQFAKQPRQCPVGMREYLTAVFKNITYALYYNIFANAKQIHFRAKNVHFRLFFVFKDNYLNNSYMTIIQTFPLFIIVASFQLCYDINGTGASYDNTAKRK